ncbi:helix-turn-helix domain-containing protein [Entomohabitans teleogrylli]|uniref:helix-turn-helix domain-containing protein n=1 Tax=Entomohabitans teleogrylli TaxID=1384589 RepID=UPI00073D46B6|nr:XRE family transcriptional regulator [Entomohabitans teleogrylli]
MDIAHYLAQTLRSLRAARGWSLSHTAEVTGVSKAMLGQIERNESSPTVATLWKIATGFNVPFSLFIEPPASGATRPVFDPQQRQMVVVPLFPYDEQLKFDLFAITLAPGGCSTSTPHERGVVEHVVVIDGRLDMQTGAQWHTLQAGEGLRFAGDERHTYRNSSDADVLFHSLIHYALQGVSE